MYILLSCLSPSYPHADTPCWRVSHLCDIFNLVLDLEEGHKMPGSHSSCGWQLGSLPSHFLYSIIASPVGLEVPKTELLRDSSLRVACVGIPKGLAKTEVCRPVVHGQMSV